MPKICDLYFIRIEKLSTYDVVKTYVILSVVHNGPTVELMPQPEHVA